MSDVNGSLLLLLTAGALLGLLLAYGAAMLIVRMRKGRPGAEKSTEMGFVVDTFHDLVTRLKDKERELEELRARAEERAGRVEGYNENILQSVPSGVVSLDVEGAVVKVNAPAERILGLAARELLGRSAPGVLGEGFGAALRAGQAEAVERGELQYTTPSGARLWLGYSLTPLLDAEGARLGRLLVFTDLTGLKALEGQARLRQNLASLGEMAAGMAHELRNPMAVIKGYMKLLGKRADPAMLDIVRSVDEEVMNMDRIVSDFLSFARPREPDLGDVDLAALAAECAESALAGRQGIKLSVEIPADAVLRADAALMRQALLNLFQNAADAQPQGGTLSVGARREGDHLLISVSDSGHGIPGDLRDKVFLPFYTTKEKGTGLGLAIVHRIVTSHGGSVEFSSGPQGTTFTLRMPGGRS